MARLQAVFYRASNGSEPVDDFIESLKDPARQAAIDNQFDRLNLLTPSNPHLPFPAQLAGSRRAAGAPLPLRLGALPDPVPTLEEPDRAAAHVPQGHWQAPPARDSDR
jgi:hypothetical protein